MLNGTERVCVQGITGKFGQYHTGKMKAYGTNIVCGVSPNSEFDDVHGIKVYQNIKKAVEETAADTSILFVPAKFVYDAVNDAIDAGIKKVIIITEHVPQLDSLRIVRRIRELNALNDGEPVMLIGPNCPGLIIPNVMKIGIMPEAAFKSGDVAVISRSGTLMYEVAKHLSTESSGVKIAIGLGGDPVIGTNVAEAMDFIIGEGIKKVVIVGEVGGNDEVTGIKSALEKGFNGEIQTFFAGRSAPKGKKMGHAGAIVGGFEETIEHKEKVLTEMGIKTIQKIENIFMEV
ncbi:MAG TPA: CoA-binding protein [Syntrophales bacterium]|nr:CoA-binding protein [Syntrophales bacterium]